MSAQHIARNLVAADPLHNHTGQLLEMLFDQMPMGIVVFDRAYRIVRSNPAASFQSLRCSLIPTFKPL